MGWPAWDNYVLGKFIRHSQTVCFQFSPGIFHINHPKHQDLNKRIFNKKLMARNYKGRLSKTHWILKGKDLTNRLSKETILLK
jgi:hypothetical protein